MRNPLILACLLGLAQGCAFNRPTILTALVGPPASAVPSLSPKGALAVYSAFDHGTPGDPPYASPHHSGYRLLSAEGSRLKYIYNRTSSFSEDPEIVPLSPGTYKIVATASAFGTVIAPVLIEAGKTTSVHLDRSELPGRPHGPAFEFVSLPNGRIIGWRAKGGE